MVNVFLRVGVEEVTFVAAAEKRVEKVSLLLKYAVDAAEFLARMDPKHVLTDDLHVGRHQIAEHTDVSIFDLFLVVIARGFYSGQTRR